MNEVNNKSNEWYENIYFHSNESGEGIPWAERSANPIFKMWIDKLPETHNTKTALVVGCGLGDDAIELEAKGFKVTAFDVSDSAIELCKKRHPNSKVNFVKADILENNTQWHRKFDYVLEIFTIQGLSPYYEKNLIKHISDFVANSGQLAIIAGVQYNERTFESGPPWPLNINYIKSFENCGLKKIFNFISDEKIQGDETHLTIFER